MKEAIRRFDEIISEKANKFDITKLQKFTSDTFIKLSTWEEFLVHHKEADEQHKNNLHGCCRQIAEFENRQEEIIAKSVSFFLNQKMQAYDKVTVAFSKFFNGDELSRVIENKVDNHTLVKVAESKASRKELDAAMSIVENVY